MFYLLQVELQLKFDGNPVVTSVGIDNKFSTEGAITFKLKPEARLGPCNASLK